jgi:mannonate dehydratase
MERREALRMLSAGTLAAGSGLWNAPANAATAVGQAAAAMKGVAPIRIRDIKTTLTAPDGIRLVVVKVETSEPGLYGLGCATFTQRAYVVQTAIEQYLKPFLIGRDVDEIEDIWQSSYVSSYWRNGPVLFNAMSGVDIALWDIKGKRAGMPVYQLLGGKCRLGAACYYHADGRDFQEVEDSARKGMALGYRHIRVQAAVPGLATYGASRTGKSVGGPEEQSGPTRPGDIWDSAPYVRMVPKLFEHLRKTLGDDVELLHDVHERVMLPEAVNLCKSLEPYRLFFLEDPLPPEENDHFRLLRQQSSVPIAMGELFNTLHEFVPLISERLIDFIRIHISQIGGLSPARKVQAFSEYFGVRTAWHGPGDASPVAHAAQLALELASYNFGIHEGGRFPQATRDVFPGCPETKDGYMMATEAPGLGVDIDEKAAAKFPFPPGPPNFDYSWGTTRRRDGTVIRP